MRPGLPDESLAQRPPSHPLAASRMEWVAAAVGLGAVLAVTAVLPSATVWMPVSIGAIAVGVALLTHPLVGLSTLIGAAFVILESAEGVQPVELAYFGLLVGYLATWYGRRLLLPGAYAPLVRSSEDALAAALLVLGAGGGTILGLALGSPPAAVAADVLALLPLALYFPVRDTCASGERGAQTLLCALVALGVGAFLYMCVLLYVRVTSATMAWEVIDVRFPGFELPLMIPAVALLGVVAYANRRASMVALGIVGVLLVGIVIAKSRGFWIGWAFGAGVLWVLAQKDQRRPLLARSASAVGVAGLLAVLIAGPVVLALALGVVARLETLADALSSDLSLINRYAETEAVMEKARTSPVLGHGLGATYRYYSLTSLGTRTWSFVHNGFAALWLKWGLWGGPLLLGLWGRAIWCGVRAARQPALPPVERGMAVGLAAALAGVLVTAYTSNPFFSQIPVLCTTVVIGLAVGLDHRARALTG